MAEAERYAAAVRIANPMYDAAFKYLMDDDASARLLVGAVLGEEVESLQVPGNRSVLEVDERQLPERYAPVLRRLAGAAASVEVSDSMALEDEVSETWGRMKRESAAKDAALAEQETALAAKDAALAAKDAALAEQDAALVEKDAALARERADREAAEERAAEMARRLAELDRE